ncbi:PTS sugar transporter subunit IIC [Erysipelothrix urinaevulpis]|uniref:PTS sugar transporter subunit IIC n=1 Tax=Erysipelothrix urinaevulpis TaxID=2683717 RepID=UPI001F304434|nr:PTS transporter subunit EIIC [Erysipelothrix urinaevulpis]
MMDKIFKFVEEKLLPPMAKFAEIRYLRAIRDGIISVMPVIMIGSFFILIALFPVPAWKALVADHVATLMIPFRLTTGLMSVYAAYGMGYALAKTYDMDGISGGVLSMSAFLLTAYPQPGMTAAGDALGNVIPMTGLDGSGMFTAILTMIFAVEVLRFCKEKNITIKMPPQVPKSVSRSFEALIPGFIIIVSVWFITHFLGFNINEALLQLFSPLVKIAGNTYIGVIIPVLFISLLWASGVHGYSIIGSIFRPVWAVLMAENMMAVANGGVAQNIGTEGLIGLFVAIGGAGGTLAMAILFTRAKSTYLKQIGRLSIIPGIFNINEPIIFGAPVVLNPILAIPFILGPVITASTAYFAMKMDWVSRISVDMPFTVPAPISGFLATGGDWRGTVLVLFNLVLLLLIYAPFVKAYDKKMLEQEQAGVEL